MVGLLLNSMLQKWCSNIRSMQFAPYVCFNNLNLSIASLYRYSILHCNTVSNRLHLYGMQRLVAFVNFGKCDKPHRYTTCLLWPSNTKLPTMHPPNSNQPNFLPGIHKRSCGICSWTLVCIISGCCWSSIRVPSSIVPCCNQTINQHTSETHKNL